MIIRRAKREDINQIINLLSQVLKVHVELRPDVFVNDTTKYRVDELKEMVEDDNNPIYVIGEDKEVYGYAFCQIRSSKVPHLFKRNKTFYIDDFCIDEKMRRKHLGQTLFEFLKEEAKRLDCQDMTRNCCSNNEAA